MVQTGGNPPGTGVKWDRVEQISFWLNRSNGAGLTGCIREPAGETPALPVGPNLVSDFTHSFELHGARLEPYLRSCSCA